MDLSTLSPVEIDTILADLYGKQWDLNSRIDMGKDDVKGAVRKVLGLSYRQSPTREQVAEVVEKAQDLGERPSYEDHAAFVAWLNLDEVAKRQERVDEMIGQYRRLGAEMAPYEAEYAKRRWTRFFVVQGGHIHSSMACSTCNKMGKATQFHWLPERSGQSEEQALESLVTESAKTVLCSVCFPSAPVAWTVPREDESVCKGSGTFDYPSETARRGYAYGNYGVCSHCGQRASTTSTGKMRKHKKA
jgi:hypothetical protein